MVKPLVEHETKREKFKRLATQRTRNILKALKILGNCSNASAYEYQPEEIMEIFQVIEKETKRVKSMFKTNIEQEFKL